MTTRYKVTDANLRAAHGGAYQYTIGEWTEPIPDPAICAHGYHTTSDPMQWPVIGMRVFACETRDDGDHRDDKQVHGSIRLTTERPDLVPDWWHEVERFVASINDVRWFDPQGDPDPAWRVFPTRAAAWDAARTTDWGSARTTDWGSAWDAGRAAAQDAGRAAARDAAWDAAGAAAWAAAWAAGLMAQIAVCNGLPLDQRHIDHARARWEVWQRGYGLLCDVDGQLHVYRRIA